MTRPALAFFFAIADTTPVEEKRFNHAPRRLHPKLHRTGFALPLGLILRHDLAKIREIGAAELGALQGRIADRVRGTAIDADFEMEMRPGAAAGISGVADQIALLDVGAGDDTGREGRQVAVDGGELARMLDLDPVAVAALGLRSQYHAVAGGIDRCADRRRKIDAVVHLHRMAGAALAA